MVIADTHIIIWAALQPDSLSEKAVEALNNSAGIIICEISLWEIAMLIKKQRLQISISYLEFMELVKASNNYHFKGMDAEIANLSVNLLPEINSDPADRTICATSIKSGYPLITADKNLQNSKLIETIW